MKKGSTGRTVKNKVNKQMRQSIASQGVSVLFFQWQNAAAWN